MDNSFEPSFAGCGTLEYGHTGLPTELPWVPMVSAPARYPLSAWMTTMHELIRHPERSSSSILRADIWEEDAGEVEHGPMACTFRCIRRLLPRRSHVDSAMLEECAIYADDSSAFVVYTALRTSPEGETSSSRSGGMLAASKRTQADLATASEMPYYHPAVRCVSLHYSAGGVRIDYVPFESSDLSDNGRLGRTALQMLRLVHKHSCGNANSYEKRVHHDIIVPRDVYQDYYMELRTRYAGRLIDTWQEATDPKKHVFEDIAIAAWLITLWRRSYGGAPPGGFVDLGCGNGLLVHILASEGFRGFGFDARARKSWPAYSADLREVHIDPQALVDNPAMIPHGAFLIGNHADELTPWVPAIATAAKASGFVNIPCCTWKKDGTRFTNTSIDHDLKEALDRLSGADTAMPLETPPSPHDALVPSTREEFAARTLWHLRRCTTSSDDAGTSKHFAYYAYIARLHLESGWPLETEVLRIPSTKNWAFVARVAHAQLCSE
ncbi:tRNA(Ser) (uridine(44)-2'-O)-methyltransferase [Malassezia cuniculi]|uniref:tRNA (uracil-O(2)-)-methyltransferase n=1 Tax=Malassezia cuniculi TaxID=948313 RepID=A0AAF0EVM5_9BASI|nr:tRNA(Ser) (uridine(44)-2'-O)-methyltransferase [Malassezia cuniculi]